MAGEVEAALRQQERFGEAQRLAKLKKFRCRGPCDQIMDEEHGVSVVHQGSVALAVCFTCLNRYDVILSRGPRGIDVKLKERGLIVVQT
jgi:hypothetical protein